MHCFFFFFELEIGWLVFQVGYYALFQKQIQNRRLQILFISDGRNSGD